MALAASSISLPQELPLFMQTIVAATILTACEVAAAFGLSLLLRRVLVGTR